MKVIVVGGGKVGFYLSKTLIEHKHEPCIIETSTRLCTNIANNLDIPVICGDGSTIDVLKSAGIENADALVAVTGQDEVNLITCQLAKKIFHIERTVARVNNPLNVEVMKQLGVDIPISSTDNIARLVERELDTAAIKQLMTLNGGDTTINEIELPQNYELSGARLNQLVLPEESIIVSITRKGRLIIPRGNAQIFSEDKIIVVAQSKVLHALNRALKLG